MQTKPGHRHDPDEELVNILTHGLGFALSLGGAVLLMRQAFSSADITRSICFAVYSLSLVLLYASSLAYHLFYKSAFVFKLRILDHAMIYVLIAGTYTPYTLLVLPPGWAWPIFIIIWVLAAAGVMFKLFFTGRFDRLDAFMYLGMGWLAIVAIKPMWQHMEPGAMFWVVAGGLSYTAGVAFYLWEKLRFNHGIWHMFVLGGSISHWLGVYLYL